MSKITRYRGDTYSIQATLSKSSTPVTSNIDEIHAFVKDTLVISNDITK